MVKRHSKKHAKLTVAGAHLGSKHVLGGKRGRKRGGKKGRKRA